MLSTTHAAEKAYKSLIVVFLVCQNRKHFTIMPRSIYNNRFMQFALVRFTLVSVRSVHHRYGKFTILPYQGYFLRLLSLKCSSGRDCSVQSRFHFCLTSHKRSLFSKKQQDR